jgi:hypothetical protein
VTPKKVPVEVNVSKEVKESSTLSQKEAKEDQG